MHSYDAAMARWHPDAEGRLRQAAIELFTEYGYDAVTITQIAERAGLTRRSYFRYFPDKREVLFAGSERLAPAVTKVLETTDRRAAPLDRIVTTLVDVGEQMIKHIGHAPDRRTIIASSNELTERERTKLAAVAQAITACFTGEGLDKAVAQLAGRIGVDLFQNAFDRYLDDSRSVVTWSSHLAHAVEDLSKLSGPEHTIPSGRAAGSTPQRRRQSASQRGARREA